MTEHKSVAIVGGHTVTVFDRCQYDESNYSPDHDSDVQAALVDHNKIFRASYGTKIHYQRLALESRRAWEAINETTHNESASSPLFNACGMLRVLPTAQLGALERETLSNMERDGIRDTQFVKSNPEDLERARERGWDQKVLIFNIPDTSPQETFEAVLDSLASCNVGVTFHFGLEKDAFDGLVEETAGESRKAIGLKTKDGIFHKSDITVIATGSFSTQLLPELTYHIESSAGSVVTYKVSPTDTELWEKYSPERFPVMTWKCTPRDKQGKDTGSVYVFPRTPEGLIKIGYRGIKPAPPECGFTQDGKWSVPLSPKESRPVPESAREAIQRFVSIFLPEFEHQDFFSTKLCWYTDTLDNSFLIDYVPTYAENSVFVCTGGSGHGAKFLPILGEHAADILEHGDESTSYMRPHWRWREDARRGNGLEEGPNGPRNIGRG
ncbi:hypothetical protein LCI18_012247 [Fusarium solani-melongenae]|uniref:Uncharacterized protein n=1 Tax=Fusarium solani subsp. cucurbitae TaxID=2747967 RepID=A0ACD3ZJ96_FUSSC|nr:hypothetical protein LCI18_012247 [Fusarium solani-melongenae]